MGFVGMTFIKCASCGCVVRVWSRIDLSERVGLTEDAAVEDADGSFACPFCGTQQQPSQN